MSRLTAMLTAPHTLLYRLTGGKFGGRVWGMRVILLTTVGRKSGQSRTTPLSSVEYDGGYVVIASNGGRPHHPAWFLNLQHQPHASIQVADRQLDVNAEVLPAAEREAMWSRIVAVAPMYDRYAHKTEREIPLVMLRPINP